MEAKTLDQARTYLQEVAEELNATRELDPLEVYRVLTDIGKELPQIAEADRTDANFVYGCISNVYVAAQRDGTRITFTGSSDAHVVRGYLAVLIHALSGLEVADLAGRTREMVEQFAKDTQLRATLTPNRANAFGNIYQLMVEHATSAA